VQRAAHRAAIEASGQHLHTVEQHDGNAVAVLREGRVAVDVDHFERVSASPRRLFDDGLSLRAEQAADPRHESHGPHRGIVAVSMRPGTVLVIVLLLAAILVAAAVFVVQLVSAG